MSGWVATESTHYCKADLKLGTPIVVENLLTKKRKNTSKWTFEGFDKKGNEVKFVCEYIEGKKDKSGARVKLVKYTKLNNSDV